MTHRNHVTWEWLQSKCRWDKNLHKFEEVAKETDVCQNQNGFLKRLCKKAGTWAETRWRTEKRRWMKHKTDKNVQEKRNLWLLWTEEWGRWTARVRVCDKLAWISCIWALSCEKSVTDTPVRRLRLRLWKKIRKWTCAVIVLIHGVLAWIVYWSISIRRQL